MALVFTPEEFSENNFLLEDCPKSDFDVSWMFGYLQNQTETKICDDHLFDYWNEIRNVQKLDQPAEINHRIESNEKILVASIEDAKSITEKINSLLGNILKIKCKKFIFSHFYLFYSGIRQNMDNLPRNA